MLIKKVIKEIKHNSYIYVIAISDKDKMVAGEYVFRSVKNYKEVNNKKEGVEYIEKIISNNKE